MRSSAKTLPIPATTRVLKQRHLRDLVEALAALFPAGHYDGLDLRGHTNPTEVFVTRERRGTRSVACGVRIVVRKSEFILDDGADEFGKTRLIGQPAFDHDGNVSINVMARQLDGAERGCALWIAHDLSIIAVEDDVCFLR